MNWKVIKNLTDFSDTEVFRKALGSVCCNPIDSYPQEMLATASELLWLRRGGCRVPHPQGKCICIRDQMCRMAQLS